MDNKYVAYNMVKADIAERVKALRNERDYSQDALAVKLGYSSGDKISARERNKRREYYNLEDCISVCNLFGVDMDYLLGAQHERTHEVKDLKTLTGLSEKACEILASERNNKSLMRCLSHLIEQGVLDQLKNGDKAVENYIFRSGSNAEPLESEATIEDIFDVKLYRVEDNIKQAIDDYFRAEPQNPEKMNEIIERMEKAEQVRGSEGTNEEV